MLDRTKVNFQYHRFKPYLNIFPIFSTIAFLLLSLALINPKVNFQNVYAADNVDDYTDEGVDEDYGVMPLEATAGLTISGDATNKQVAVAPGNTGYREHRVKVSASDITAYTLTISGPTNLAGPTGATTIGGADNKQGSAMVDNTWGYGWGETTATKEDLYYQTLSSTGTNLSVPAVKNYAASFSRKLVFAAKFGEENTGIGSYTADVTLSLVATPLIMTYTIIYDANGGSGAPSSQTCTIEGRDDCITTLSATIPKASNTTATTTKAGLEFLGWATNSDTSVAEYSPGDSITLDYWYNSYEPLTLYAVWKIKTQAGFSSISNMQQMTATICKNAKVGDYKDLTDSRDSNKYRVVKFGDGRCWMTDNLKIYNKTLQTSTSDFTSGSVILPNSGISAFTSANESTFQAYYNTSIATTAAGINTTTYYNYYTARAGASGATASTSICPKAWKLPSPSEFASFVSAESIAYSEGGSTKVQDSPYNFKATGYIDDKGSLKYGTSYGGWWSNSATTSTSLAYIMSVNDGQVFPSADDDEMNRDSMELGYAVRCIASS